MKRTISIHIGGYVFNIDEDAYQILEQWLNAVQAKFAQDPDGKEIVQDIEIGAAEHLQKMLSDSAFAVTIENVQAVIQIMGDVSDFEENANSEQKSESSENFETETKSAKKFYRDLDNRYIGGVSSGLGHYIGIQPIWIRLAFILSTAFFAGSGLVIYVLLLVMTQPARTRAEKLAMKGERVNIDNIKDSVKDEFVFLKHRFGKFKNSEEFSDFKRKAQEIGINVSDIVAKLLKIIVILVGVSFVFVTFSILTAFTLFFFTEGWFFLPADMVYFSEIEQVMPLSSSAVWFKIGLMLLIGMPIAGIMFGGLRMIFNFKTKKKIFGIAGTLLWFTGLGLVIVSGTKIGENLREEATIRQSYPINLPDSTLYVSTIIDNIEKNADRVRDMEDMKIISIGTKMRIYFRPEFTLNYTEDTVVTLQTEYFARGESRKSAEKNALSTNFKFTVQDSTLSLPEYYALSENAKFKGESVSVTLNVPKNYKIHLDKNIDRFRGYIDFKTGDWHGSHPNRMWQMTDEGLELIP